jgi:hypothetical protein
MSTQFPTSKDVTFELNGRSIAVVQSYNTSYSKEDKEVDAFGEEEPIGFAPGKKQYTIKITKAYIHDSAVKDGINFYNINNFDFVIVKPDKRIVYTGCSITSIEEEGSLNDVIAENINIRATRRREDAI